MTGQKQKASLLLAFTPIIFLLLAIFINVSVFGSAALDGSNQMILIISGFFASIIALTLGYDWEEIMETIVKNISSSISSILILLMIGALTGSWMVSGVVPVLIYYGLAILSPTVFLFAACVCCAVVSVATGSSWTTVGTVGLALMGIGQAMGIGEGMVAGAILSGAYFGDKMSPLSDTTNLAAAVAGTDLFTHIRYMTITTVPSMIISLILFLIIGFVTDHEFTAVNTFEVSSAIANKFNISGWVFLVPLAVFVMIWKKITAFPALMVGSLLGILFAIVFQPHLLMEVATHDGGMYETLFVGSMKALYGSISMTTPNTLVNELLSSSGMAGMLNTIWLIISAMVFGGAMQVGGFLEVITNVIISRVNSVGSLISSTVGTAIFFNLTTSDQYLSIIIPGKMYSEAFPKKGLAPENLSRTLEDGATVTSVLVPWNTCGAYHQGVLGVQAWAFIPYCFFNLLSPLMTILVGYMNYKIRYKK